MLHERDVRLDEPWLHYVVAQAGARIERANVLESRLHGLHGAADGLTDFFVLLVLQAPQMVFDYGDRILQNLCRAIAILVQRELSLVITKLGK